MGEFKNEKDLVSEPEKKPFEFDIKKVPDLEAGDIIKFYPSGRVEIRRGQTLIYGFIVEEKPEEDEEDVRSKRKPISWWDEILIILRKERKVSFDSVLSDDSKTIDFKVSKKLS